MNLKDLKERFERRLLDEKETEFLFSKVEEMQKAMQLSLIYINDGDYRAAEATLNQVLEG